MVFSVAPHPIQRHPLRKIELPVALDEISIDTCVIQDFQMCVLQWILRRKNVRVDEWNLTSDFYPKKKTNAIISIEAILFQ